MTDSSSKPHDLKIYLLRAKIELQNPKEHPGNERKREIPKRQGCPVGHHTPPAWVKPTGFYPHTLHDPGTKATRSGSLTRSGARCIPARALIHPNCPESLHDSGRSTTRSGTDARSGTMKEHDRASLCTTGQQVCPSGPRISQQHRSRFQTSEFKEQNRSRARGRHTGQGKAGKTSGKAREASEKKRSINPCTGNTIGKVEASNSLESIMYRVMLSSSFIFSMSE